MLPIHYLAVVVAAVASFIIGFIFHSPPLGNIWMKLADIHPTGNEKMSDMIPQMLYNLLANVVTAYVLAVIYLYASTSQYLPGPGLWSGVIIGLWIWLGFLVTTSSIPVIWMGGKKSLWLYEACASFIVMAVMGAIIAVM